MLTVGYLLAITAGAMLLVFIATTFAFIRQRESSAPQVRAEAVLNTWPLFVAIVFAAAGAIIIALA